MCYLLDLSGRTVYPSWIFHTKTVSNQVSRWHIFRLYMDASVVPLSTGLRPVMGRYLEWNHCVRKKNKSTSFAIVSRLHSLGRRVMRIRSAENFNSKWKISRIFGSHQSKGCNGFMLGKASTLLYCPFQDPIPPWRSIVSVGTTCRSF